ncbi:hypothetical protein [Sphaerimonospora mesophila]|uniref:hypothetical protein n=1 Tax=Sphaerimonospora mesophila TaxID=37483 RepID=UPI0006E19F02
MARRPRRARTPEELLRDLDDRIRVLEHRTSVVVGVPPNAYLLAVDQDGQLVATNTTTGRAAVVASP